MIISMASFAVGDTFVKISGAFLSPAQIMFFLIAGGLIIFAMIAKFKGENLLDSRAFSPVLLIRYLAEMIGLVAMIMGLTKIPLSVVGTVTSITHFSGCRSCLFFKEIVSWRRWSSIVIGFIGVVLVIQPGSQNLDYAVIWAVVALVAFSIRFSDKTNPTRYSICKYSYFYNDCSVSIYCSLGIFGGEKFFLQKLIGW